MFLLLRKSLIRNIFTRRQKNITIMSHDSLLSWMSALRETASPTEMLHYVTILHSVFYFAQGHFSPADVCCPEARAATFRLEDTLLSLLQYAAVWHRPQHRPATPVCRELPVGACRLLSGSSFYSSFFQWRQTFKRGQARLNSRSEPCNQNKKKEPHNHICFSQIFQEILAFKI